MIDANNTRISPLLSFDFYLESYHKLLIQLKKEVDLKQMKSLLRNDIDHSIQQIINTGDYDALVITDLNQEIVWVNEGFTEMTGYHKKYALRKRPSFLQGAKTSKTIKKQIREQLKTHYCYKGTITNYRKNGEAYRCQINIFPMYGSKGEPTHFIALEKELLAA
jgi:PAS domain S-box-containing protein